MHVLGSSNTPIKGALLLTKFKTLEELKKTIQIKYEINGKPAVHLTHSSSGREVKSTLKAGISEIDILNARDGGFWDRVSLVLNCPYAIINRKDMARVFTMARRRQNLFGEGDLAFYDLAETSVHNISDDDIAFIPSEDLSEKGYLNTFNHITAQAFMTSIFSERLADFIASKHELRNMPELVTGEFKEDQLTDLENGAIDNYVDIINNEWGQELGKELRKKYKIDRKTNWTPELLTNYLNDIQSYYSWAFQIGFKPYKTSDELVIRYSNKINRVMKGFSDM